MNVDSQPLALQNFSTNVGSYFPRVFPRKRKHCSFLIKNENFIWGKPHYFLRLLIMITEQGAGAGLQDVTAPTFPGKTSETKR